MFILLLNDIMDFQTKIMISYTIFSLILFYDFLQVDTAEAVADKARQSFTTVLETITDAFAPRREIEEGELMIVKNSELVSLDWWQVSDIHT